MKLLLAIILLLIAGMALPTTSFSQDIIIKKNGDEISSKVLEINNYELKYKKFDNIDGPTYILLLSEVFMIKYANGTKAVINRMDVPGTSGSQKEIINEKKLFQENKTYVSIGYGFGTFISMGSSSWFYGNNGFSQNNLDNNPGTNTGPFYVKYEYGLTEDFSIGVNLAYLEYKFDDSYFEYDPLTLNLIQYTRTYKYTTFSALLRANWHYGNSEKVDPYFGFGLGYRNGTWKFTDNAPQQAEEDNLNNFPFGFETTFGIRIRFSEHIGAYAEAGFAKSAVQMGFMVKF